MNTGATWYIGEIARASAALEQVVGKWNKKRKHLQTLQQDNELLLGKISDVQVRDLFMMRLSC